MTKNGNRFLSHVLVALIRFLRPLLGPARCKFSIGCTQFAIHQLKTQHLPYACLLICKRLLQCSPLGTFHSWYKTLQIKNRL